MAGGGVTLARASQLNVAQYHGRLTWFVILVAAIAASGGLLFGYDNGCTGGVLAMETFEKKFFPDVYAAKNDPTVVANTDPYCVYDNPKIQIFTSSLFLAGMFSSLFAAKITRTFGRKITMGIGALLFIGGGLLNAFAHNIAMLVCGRLLLGFGVGQVNQVVPLYLSEMAPYQYRGGLNVCFQLCITIGILVAQLVNFGVQDWDNGWRLSLGLAAAPAAVLLVGAIILPESPNFLLEKGHHERGRRVLEKLRGTTQVDAEFEDIMDAVDAGKGIRMRQSWASLVTRRYSPQLITTVLINFFQQFTGINAIIFYVPVLFSSLGTGKSAALLNTVVIGCVNVGCTLVSVVSVDKFGRRFLLIEGGIQCCIAMICTGVVLGVEFDQFGGAELPKRVAIGVLVVICVFISGFAWSWGPLGWLVPSEIYTLETRAAGTATAVFSNFLFTFVIGQSFLSMLCAMRFGVFLFFASWLAIMVLWVIFFLPETKGVPVERVQALFAKHWFWKKWMGPAAQQVLDAEETRTASRKAASLEGKYLADVAPAGAGPTGAKVYTAEGQPSAY